MPKYEKERKKEKRNKENSFNNRSGTLSRKESLEMDIRHIYICA